MGHTNTDGTSVQARARISLQGTTRRTWFPAIETLADTRYYREVLAECSHFRSWTGRAR